MSKPEVGTKQLDCTSHTSLYRVWRTRSMKSVRPALIASGLGSALEGAFTNRPPPSFLGDCRPPDPPRDPADLAKRQAGHAPDPAHRLHNGMVLPVYPPRLFTGHRWSSLSRCLTVSSLTLGIPLVTVLARLAVPRAVPPLLARTAPPCKFFA